MKINSRRFLIASLAMIVMMVAILFSAVTISPLTAYAAERADREIVAVDSGNELNMCITDDGMLKWDAVDGATGYKVYLKKGSYTVATFDSISTSMFIASEIDQTKADSGQYLLEVAAVGVSKSASMQYYYTSNVDKLEAPTKLQWLGNNAVWEYVDDAEVLNYTLYLYNFDGLVDTITNATSPCDLSEYNPQDGWTFQVQAKGDKTLISKRSSILVESPAKGSRTKTLAEIVSSNSLNMAVSPNGMLTWDSVNGATGYKIILKQNGYNVGSFETTNTYFILDTEMNSLKFDSGSYVIEVGAKGVSKNATMNYFYTSHVDQLEAPNGLKWLGYKAIWNEVEGATSYTVSLFNFSGLVTTVKVDGTLYDFEGNLPQDGWTFKVQANGGGTFYSKRDSSFTESPALVAPTCNIGVIIVDSTNDVLNQGGQVYLQTNKATQDWTSSGGFSRKATYGTTVTLKAQPNVGYEFLGWRLDGDWASGEAEYQFTASIDSTYYAMFQKVDYYFIMQPTDHTVAKGNAINVKWSTNIVPSKTEIQYWDETAQDWDQWDVNNEPANQQDDYDFQNAQAESIRFRLVAYTGETPIAYSDEFTITWVEPNIELFEATITEPVGGEHPSFELKLANADMYSYRLLKWYDGSTQMSNSDTFIAGKKYRLNVLIEAKSGYEFTNTAVYKVNNVNSVGDGVFKDFYFTAAEPEVVTYEVIYNPSEGQGSVDLDYCNAGTTITLKTPQELGFYALDGKMFDAWKINEVRYEPGDEYLVNSDTIITALWKNVPVTATALSATYNGGNILAGTKINPAGIVITMTYSNSTQTPIDAGSVEYWYNGTQIQDPINYVFGVELIGTCTITVKYLGLETTFDVQVVGYEIIFNANTGSGTMASVEYVGAYTLPACGFTAPTGKQFKCWAEGSASGTQYAVGYEYDVTANVTFYAVWENISHTCGNGVLQSGQGATCTVNGWKDYYQCACGKYYEDANCTKLISDLEAWKAGEGKIVAEHTYGDLIDENPAVHTQTELQAGMRAHYHCSVCGTYFDSSKNETTAIALTISAPTHSFGDWIKDNEKHWKVCSCGLKADEHTHNYTDSADMICNDCGYDRTVPHTCGNGTKQDGKAATCTENGWNDYFKCFCGKIYTDAACTNEITSLEAWKNGDGKIAASHSYGDLVAKVDATCSQAGMEAHYECSVCHTLFDENKAVKTANELTIDIDANAHTYGAWTSNGDGTHSRVCGINANHKETVACSGGTATCTEKAVCEVCNTPYGNTAAHQHGSEWHNDADEHWNECACGDKANVAPHADTNNDGKCDTCDYAMGNAENPGENIESEKDGLSGGAIAGIVVGSVAGAAALGCGGFAIFWFVIKKKKFADLIALFKKK